eukprot:CAMPEP_0185025670 /NCGR_PEP_ID=MMETSP1103-20130426/8730_1 /TAXON_ID=36769 /ORGANISM="Paraphysomonas bandaiensis, Strain Caron Lab Isolate" /LENGTH=145 /DNA_ID=CAMNT_0027558939 /DNA_START=57 /DNA_END=494 /DNA_ORIENTATION=+
MAAKRIRCGRLGVATRPFAGTMHYVAEKPTSLSEWWVKYENTAIAIHETADIATVLALWFSIDAVCGGMGFDYALALKEMLPSVYGSYMPPEPGFPADELTSNAPPFLHKMSAVFIGSILTEPLKIGAMFAFAERLSPDEPTQRF